MPAHCQSDMAEVPESVNRSMKTASEGIWKRLNPPLIRRRSRSFRGRSWIFSTTLTRQGSGRLLLIEFSPHVSAAGEAAKIKNCKPYAAKRWLRWRRVIRRVREGGGSGTGFVKLF